MTIHKEGASFLVHYNIWTPTKAVKDLQDIHKKHFL